MDDLPKTKGWDPIWKSTLAECDFCHQMVTLWRYWTTGAKACKPCFDRLSDEFDKQHEETMRQLKGEWF